MASEMEKITEGYHCQPPVLIAIIDCNLRRHMVVEQNGVHFKDELPFLFYSGRCNNYNEKNVLFCAGTETGNECWHLADDNFIQFVHR